MTIKYVVSYSGGVSSWCAARRLLDGGVDPSEVVLAFADTLFESDGLYAFLDASVANLGCEFVRLVHGQTPWELFDSQGMIANSRADLCSRMLKRELVNDWIADNHPTAVRVFGFDWSEDHRTANIRRRHAPAEVLSPLAEKPWLSKSEQFEWARREGLPVSPAYEHHAHDNCRGQCVKAGIAHWRHLYHVDRCGYLEREAWEQAFRDRTGKDVAILRDRSGGETTPLTLAELRRRIEAGGQDGLFPDDEWGGCGCGA
jgi:3'-phosphoadenosine 5'-phosphosulfate sulfotransferase (PAPS reductase)/FAD synthetase